VKTSTCSKDALDRERTLQLDGQRRGSERQAAFRSRSAIIWRTVKRRGQSPSLKHLTIYIAIKVVSRTATARRCPRHECPKSTLSLLSANKLQWRLLQ